MLKPALIKALSQKPFAKIIAGLKNTDSAHVGLVVKAAVDGGAHAVDLPAIESTVSGLKQSYSDIAFFVSALDSKSLIEAAKWGVDAVEFGNFDALYAEGKEVSAEWVWSVVKDVKAELPEGVAFVVTVPGHWSIDDQVTFASELKEIGIDLLQIENVGHGFGAISAIKKSVDLPIILAGGLNLDNIGEAISSGAEGFGIGRIVSDKPTVEAMTAEVKALVAKIAPVVIG